jgi:hypothetical protein
MSTPATAHHNESDGVFSVLSCGPHKSWIPPAQDPIHRAPDDPVVFPGQPGASHLHEFGGNVTTNAHSTYGSMIGQATDCPYPKDAAAYWFPALLDKQGNPAPVFAINAYYRDVPTNPDLPHPKPYPPDFRIMAGAPVLEANGKPKVYFSCTDTEPKVSYPPDCAGVEGSLGVKANVIFPECLKYGTFDSPDHRSHMTYATWGGCPEGYELVPQLGLFITWKVKDAETAGYRLSSDTPGMLAGHSLHADFWNTWDQAELERLTQACIVEHGDVPESTAEPACKALES